MNLKLGMNQEKFKIILLLNSEKVYLWQFKIIEEIIKSPENSIEAIFIHDSYVYKSKRQLKNLFWELFERYFVKLKSKEIISPELFKSLPKHLVKPIKKGYKQEWNKPDLELIQSYKSDLIIRFGFGILSGEILNSAKYGVLSFHHGNPEIYRGGPPAFWELLHGKKEAGIIIQILSNKLDAGKILVKENFKLSAHSYSESLDHLFLNSALLINKALYQLKKQKYISLNSLGKIYKSPNNFNFIIFLAGLLINKIKIKYQNLFLQEIWAVAKIQDLKINDIIQNNSEIINPKWIESSPNSYYADPFPINHNLLVEHYNYSKKLGKIALLENEKISKTYFEKDSNHYSFPFISYNENEIKIIPENYDSNSCYEYDLDLNNKKEIIPIPLIDPVLFIKDEFEWILGSLKETGSNEALFAYYREKEGLDSKFIPHPLNPIVTGLRGSRNAGPIFKLNNKFYRIAQNSTNTYGESIIIKEIIKFSPDEYEEKELKEIRADHFKKYNRGIHTLSFNEHYICIDAKRFEFKFTK